MSPRKNRPMITVNGTAEIPGIHPSTLRARMHELGIVHQETKRPD